MGFFFDNQGELVTVLVTVTSYDGHCSCFGTTVAFYPMPQMSESNGTTDIYVKQVHSIAKPMESGTINFTPIYPQLHAVTKFSSSYPPHIGIRTWHQSSWRIYTLTHIESILIKHMCLIHVPHLLQLVQKQAVPIKVNNRQSISMMRTTVPTNFHTNKIMWWNRHTQQDWGQGGPNAVELGWNHHS